ncbi:hypothetical protein AOLI_G00241570, partial [Acnodon oligacanthus]
GLCTCQSSVGSLTGSLAVPETQVATRAALCASRPTFAGPFIPWTGARAVFSQQIFASICNCVLLKQSASPPRRPATADHSGNSPEQRALRPCYCRGTFKWPSCGVVVFKPPVFRKEPPSRAVIG